MILIYYVVFKCQTVTSMILRWSSWWLSSALTLVALLSCVRLAAADADFESVRIKYDYPYMGGRGGDPKEKYWRTFELTTIQSRWLTIPD